MFYAGGRALLARPACRPRARSHRFQVQSSTASRDFRAGPETAFGQITPHSRRPQQFQLQGNTRTGPDVPFVEICDRSALACRILQALTFGGVLGLKRAWRWMLF